MATKQQPPPPTLPAATLSFEGVGFTTGAKRTFDALCGKTPPTITGGYAKWKTYERPYARALTIQDGYDPVQMKVDIIITTYTPYQGWDSSDAAGQALEAQTGPIAALEWMAGSNFSFGPSPVVYVWSHSTQGGDSGLIPRQYASSSSAHGPRYPWVIKALAWGTSYRSSNGYRIWQEATLTLEGYLGLTKSPAPETQVRGGYFVVRAGRDTPLLIAGAPSARAPTANVDILAGRICERHENNPCKGHPRLFLRGKGLRFRIPLHTPVFVPDHQLD